MPIVHKLDCNGGFTCGDTDTRITAYAYASSTHARSARRHPADVAAEMLLHERRYGFDHEANLDAMHWRTLENNTCPSK